MFPETPLITENGLICDIQNRRSILNDGRRKEYYYYIKEVICVIKTYFGYVIFA
jgi:hypothetical protein